MWRKKCNLQANYTKRNGFFIQKPWSDTRPKRLLKENDEFSDRLWKKLKHMLFSIWFLCIRLVCLPQISGRQNQVSRERDRSILKMNMSGYQIPTIFIEQDPAFVKSIFPAIFSQNFEMTNCFLRKSIYALRCSVCLLQILPEIASWNERIYKFT